MRLIAANNHKQLSAVLNPSYGCFVGATWTDKSTDVITEAADSWQGGHCDGLCQGNEGFPLHESRAATKTCSEKM